MNEREIFEAALEIADPTFRQAYLTRACAANPQLRRQVEDLLMFHATAGDFLSTPAIQRSPSQKMAPDGTFSSVEDSAELEKTHGSLPEDLSAGDAVSLEFLSPSVNRGSLGKLGHYEIHEVLGQGAFGIVLKAFDEKLHRIVAIKVLSPALARTSPPRKRFLREARSAAAIRHENVVAVYSVDDQPIPYLVMEYVSGVTLEQTLNDHGPLGLVDVLRLGQQIAAGLAAAHGRGLIHRDIKPSNILLENGLSGKVKISDFGLARTADDANLTHSVSIAGTPMYMSPEQAQSGHIDQRSDLFSLGSVLYVMISGRPPFRAPTMLAVLKRVVEDTPRPISTIMADTPSWLCAIVAKLQAKKPEDRFASAAQVADLLANCLADLQANRPIQLPNGISFEEKGSAKIAQPIHSLGDGGLPARPAQVLVPALTHSRFSGRRSWPTIAAAALILFCGLGLTESTGVTQFTSTVIRLTTGSGTLVIETDDPNVKVTIDGESVKIPDAGVELLTLKPGQYKVAAEKNGQRLSQQLVTVTRGGKQVVKVSLEGSAMPVEHPQPVAGDALLTTDDLLSETDAAERRSRAKIQHYEKLIAESGNAFNWEWHNVLRHEYRNTDPKKSFGHCNTILQHSLMDEYMLNILGGWQTGKNDNLEINNLITWPVLYPEFTFMAAACWIKAADLEKDAAKSRSYLENAIQIKGPDLDKYHDLAQSKLAAHESR